MFLSLVTQFSDNSKWYMVHRGGRVLLGSHEKDNGENKCDFSERQDALTT